ncbi:hypothetical protein ACROYT_G007434 [Oculina patagonica]
MLGRELEVPLDAITEAPPDASPLKMDYAQAVQKRLASAHDLARRHLNKAAMHQKRNYDKRLAGRPFSTGDSVWLHNVKRKKGRNPKLDCPWEGPYLVISVLSDVVYRIQKSKKAKPKREESKEASDVDSPVFVEDRQSAPVSDGEGVELVETESTLGGEETGATLRPENDDATPRLQSDCNGGDNRDQPDDVREPEPQVELPMASADNSNPEDFSRQTVEPTGQVVPEADSSARGRPSRQRKPPNWYGTSVAG